ncbi:hypothetical protein TVAG_148690 [Trichomonas vaginalis G3]|uniref:Uncharacterized protein n=1 Tax=Trichomonas vaginalis (strain ATCC PRA-98 / G3) TaxID=412133 RepID=A2FF13_TRIV3|nr:hypothetical protein TVAGG3_0661050 [Trichomonas vaginalis G3]EAX96517.1 hypothetical protein TVAG_148690 [Trichomonas vaginalis G3]KAI5506492.1 hypothetical protein TVAGG3_0661050 [Trichomonas vaginalis G3]|eukprot:XP_001309447.1 hypothetical protein [Trichomonas vaginalis G3]
MQFFLFYLSTQASIQDAILGDWSVVKLEQSGAINDDFKNQIYGIEIHKADDKIIGSIYRNNIEAKSRLNPFVDAFEVEVVENKILLKSTQNNIGTTISLEFDLIDGKYALTGTLLDQELTIAFNSADSASILYGETQYLLQREIQPEEAPISDMVKNRKSKFAPKQEKTQEEPQQPQETVKPDIKFTDTIKELLEPFKKYLYIVYTALFILVIEIILLSCGSGCQSFMKGRDAKRKANKKKNRANKANKQENEPSEK